jgi:hypothetical protein
MLDAGFLDRYFLELPKDITTPIKIPQVPIIRKTTETLVERVKPKKREPEKEDDVLKKAKKEISDAVAELVAEIEIEKKPEKPVFDDERAVYASLVDFEHKVMDYSKLGYGKIAEPLAIEWKYENYQQQQKSGGVEFHSEETISIKSVDKLIQEKVFSDLLNTSIITTTSSDRERFEYYKLFNSALITIKYDLAFA